MRACRKEQWSDAWTLRPTVLYAIRGDVDCAAVGACRRDVDGDFALGVLEALEHPWIEVEFAGRQLEFGLEGQHWVGVDGLWRK